MFPTLLHYQLSHSALNPCATPTDTLATSKTPKTLLREATEHLVLVRLGRRAHAAREVRRPHSATGQRREKPVPRRGGSVAESSTDEIGQLSHAIRGLSHPGSRVPRSRRHY
jgi:hypothetical protein